MVQYCYYFSCYSIGYFRYVTVSLLNQNRHILVNSLIIEDGNLRLFGKFFPLLSFKGPEFFLSKLIGRMVTGIL